MSTEWIAYHSDERRGFPYPHRGGQHTYLFNPKSETQQRAPLNGRIWVIVGKRAAGKGTHYFLLAAYVCNSSTPASPNSGMDWMISGAEAAYFDPPIPLDPLIWWPKFLRDHSNFQGGLKRLKSSTALHYFEEQLSSLGSRSLASQKADEEYAGIDEQDELSLAGSLEGRRRLAAHFGLERDQGLSRQKKADRLRRDGKIICECCGFDFKAMYGTLGRDFAEAHHTTPLSRYEVIGQQRTTLEQLALVCSNCHRVLHWNEDLSVEDLRRHLIDGSKPKRKLVRQS